MTRKKLKKVLEDHHKWWNAEGGKRANLQFANLQDANLQFANLQFANLRGANLQDANLQDANLQFANLQDANLQDANLQFANLQDANKERLLSQNRNCPAEGDFIAWKKVRGDIVLKLLIIGDRVSPICGRKCRTDKVKVLEAFNADDMSKSKEKEFMSKYNPEFVYRVGEIVEEKDYDSNPFVKCSTGIHFLISKQEAIDW